MKNINLAKSFTLFLFILLFSASFTLAQEAKAKKDCDESKTACCPTEKVKEAKLTSKDACTDKAKVECKDTKAKVKHACTDECKTLGCDVVKAKEAKLSSKECSDKVKTECKDTKAEAKHVCTAACADGCSAKS